MLSCVVQNPQTFYFFFFILSCKINCQVMLLRVSFLHTEMIISLITVYPSKDQGPRSLQGFCPFKQSQAGLEAGSLLDRQMWPFIDIFRPALLIHPFSLNRHPLIHITFSGNIQLFSGDIQTARQEVIKLNYYNNVAEYIRNQGDWS